ncbi:MAG: PD-(D/E)XK nuclease family protein [Arcobacter sp.]|nr:PD-(D/E)XK nuclease family protein [Arcobacter sp.]
MHNILNYDFASILQDNVLPMRYEQNFIKEINLSSIEWSATSLKVFLDCKRKYYLQYIIKLSEHDFSLKPKNYELGNIIHNLLEQNYRLKKYSYKEIADAISSYQNKNPYLALELELWKRKLKLFFQNENNRFEAGIEIFELEKSFRILHKGIVLKGKIDRIDKLKDGTFAILDYKTSSSLKIDTEKTAEKTSDFQLEFYFLATKELGVGQVGYYDLNDGNIKEEFALESKLVKLDEILGEFMTKSVDFSMCEKEQICNFCTYKILCGKE